MHQLSHELNTAQKFDGVALGRNRSVIVHGIPEPHMTEGKQKRTLRYLVMNLL